MRLRPGIGRVCALFLTVTVLAGCDRVPDQQPAQPILRPVRSITVEPANRMFWRELPGVVAAAREADLGFRVSGTLQNLDVSEGDYVDKGELLARLDPTDFQLQLDRRKAEYEQVHADYERGQAIVEKGVISRSDFNRLEAEDATALSELQQARQNYQYTQLRAPFAGRIAQRHVDNFEEVSVMEPVYTLHDVSSMDIQADVPESVMVRVRENARPRVHAIFAVMPEEAIPLTVKEVATRPTAGANTYKVTFSMPPIEAFNILPGMSVTVRGERSAEEVGGLPPDAVVVPAQAVLEDTDGRFVYTVERTAADRGVVSRTAVETGDLSSLGLAIRAGLQAGDEVVVAGVSKMFPGLEVRLPAE